jgi:putative FmdB family regulatory protein
MPTYGYECVDCGHKFEVIQRITDSPMTICEKCSGSLRKILYPVGIAFKGSGFHVNDYRRPDSGRNSSSDKPAVPAAKDA